MERKYFLVTNISGMTYWNYLGTASNTCGMHARAVAKYGDIYINRNGGWFPVTAAKTVHRTVEQEHFPAEETERLAA